MNRIYNAVNKFSDEYACSQAILTEYCERFGLDYHIALKLASGFAGGMRMGKTCGAVTGAYMVLGLNFGDSNCEKMEGRKDVYKAVCDFTKLFIEIHGSVECADLLGHDISTTEGMQVVKDLRIFQTICPNFVKTAANLLEQLIDKS
jgi:C_GCAxxG_C_C family probable redox protein